MPNGLFMKKFSIQIRVLLHLIGLIPPGLGLAQIQVNADAIQLDDFCFQLTDEVPNQASTIWNVNKINLFQPFDTTVQVMLGCNDSGGDGIVFAFQPIGISAGNYFLGQLGIENLNPTLMVEIDTYQNHENGDPVFDHIAILKNGKLDHNSPENLAGPVQASASNSDIEDCLFHDFRILWLPSFKRIEVFWDCEFRTSFTGDVIDSIFGGNPEVFWGFASGTSIAVNRQEICIGKGYELNTLEDVSICPGGEVDLVAPISGTFYFWSPPEGLSSTTTARTVAAPDSTITYTIKISDDCDRIFSDDVTVFVQGDKVELNLGDGDTSLCVGEALVLDVTNPNFEYLWSNGSTESIIEVTEAGFYSVTLVNAECVASAGIQVGFTSAPTIDLGPDTLLCEGSSILLNASFPGSEYRWQDGSTDAEFEVTQAGIYDVEVTTPCGRVTEVISVEMENCDNVFIPNVFSPNRDGINDIFFIQSDDKVVQIKAFRVFNRWGALVFEALNFPPNDETFGWNGKFHNKEVDSDVFIYMAEIEFVNGTTKIKSGDVLVLK